MPLYQGTCHCGAVGFEIDADIEELTTCDCSLCVMKNAVMTRVPEADLKILRGEERLRLYQWNTKVAEHFFCDTCGIYVFHRKRAMQDHFGVNVFCLQGLDPSQVPVRQTEGETMSVVARGAQDHWPGPRMAD